MIDMNITHKRNLCHATQKTYQTKGKLCCKLVFQHVVLLRSPFIGEANDQDYLWNWSYFSSSGATLRTLSGQMGNLSIYVNEENNTMIKGKKWGWKWICCISHVLRVLVSDFYYTTALLKGLW